MAPFVGLLQERMYWIRKGVPLGPCILFAGHRDAPFELGRYDCSSRRVIHHFGG